MKIIVSLIDDSKDVRQGLVRQGFDILSFPLHSIPPYSAEGLLQRLIFSFNPPPQVLLHLPKDPQTPHPPFTKNVRLKNV